MMGSAGTIDAAQLTIETLSTEAMTTSEIEGDIIGRASVQSSIRRQLGLDTDQRRVKAAEQGFAELASGGMLGMPSTSRPAT